MGAHDFTTTSLGKSPADAYNRASEEALYEYGHDAYNGTISTTNGFVDVSKELAPFSAKRRDVIAQASLGIAEYDPRWDKIRRGDWQVKHNVTDRFGTQTFLVPKDLRPAERDAAIRLATRYGISKWDSCGAYEVTGTLGAKYKKAMGGRRGEKVYRFFGWAAS
jgi:hypothetical protein